MRSEDIWRGFSASAGMWDYAYAEFTKGHRFRLPLPTQRGENSPNVSLRFEPLKPQAAQVVDIQCSDLDVQRE